MTLFYDYNMLFISRIYDTETFVIFFSKSSKQVHCTKSFTVTEADSEGLPHGSSNFQDKRGFGSAPHRNITFELQISHI